MIDHHFPSANSREVFFGCGHCPAESEPQTAFDFPCHESGRSGVHVHAQGIQVRRQIPSAETPVERGDSADFPIGKGSDDLLKVIRLHTYVTVAHD